MTASNDSPPAVWLNFLESKRVMLDKYDSARRTASTATVQVEHGNVAEAEFRAWLESFLPKRYGVTAGYLVSHCDISGKRGPHYDVIIYDALESPVLWVENNQSRSSLGVARAIPVEHVLSVIEVKAGLTKQAAKDGLDHLNSLRPYLTAIDIPDTRYPRYLPAPFSSWIVFYELRAEDAIKHDIIDELVPSEPLRGYIGGVVLRGAGNDAESAGYIRWVHPDSPPWTCAPHTADYPLTKGPHLATKRQQFNGEEYGIMLKWSDNTFCAFAFDLLAMLNNTFDPGHVSSMHARRP